MHLKALRPLPYPREPITLGEHLRKRRGELGLQQRDVARQVGVNASTILNWETGRTTPPIRHLPLIIEFLGYDPWPLPKSLAEQLQAKRRQLGLSRKRAARCLGVDEGTLVRWEERICKPKGQHLAWITDFLAMRRETGLPG